MLKSHQLIANLIASPLNQRLGPYVADFGRVSLAALVTFIGLTTWAEIAYPGLITNWLAPGQLIGLAVAAGVLALWPAGSGPAVPTMAPIPKNARYCRLATLGLAAAFGIVTGLWANQYFAPLPAMQGWLALTSGLVVGTTVWLVSSDY